MSATDSAERADSACGLQFLCLCIMLQMILYTWLNEAYWMIMSTHNQMLLSSMSQAYVQSAAVPGDFGHCNGFMTVQHT
jgi:hypothetical protein